jgi:hypothetical protein
MDQVGPDPRSSGPKGWPPGPTPWPVGHGLRRFAQNLGVTRLHKEEKPESVEKVGGRHSTRSAGHMAWPPDHHLAPNRLLQVGGGPIHSYKYTPSR